MAMIATLITDLFSDTEYLQPAAAFKKAGHRLFHIGLETRNQARGLNAQTAVTIDSNASEARARGFDALFIPGGYSPDRLRGNNDVMRLVREFMQLEKPVFTIGHGLQLLISACILAGRKVAGSKSLAQDIANAGGILSDRKVIIDNNLISCCGAAELNTFIVACLQKLSPKRSGQATPRVTAC